MCMNVVGMKEMMLSRERLLIESEVSGYRSEILEKVFIHSAPFHLIDAAYYTIF